MSGDLERRFFARTVGCAILALLLAFGRPAVAAPPDVLLITVDTLRPDALGWVSGRGGTTHLDRLANQGVRFPAAVTTAPLTLPAHASLMTGLLPRRHGVRDNGQLLSPAPALLAERLGAAGYATAAFVSGYPLKGFFGLGRGFDHYDDHLENEGTRRGERQWLERPASRTTVAALSWAATAKRPFFVWVHYYDPHYPYDAPGEGRAAYYGEVAAVDRAVGELIESLPGGERLTVFASDHGESLGEHGEGTHGFFIYDSTITVPLVFHWPQRLEPLHNDGAVSLVDVVPTVLELLALEVPPNLDGRSLAPVLTGNGLPAAPAFSETWQPWTSYGWSPLKSVRLDGWKLIAAPEAELYDLAGDPGETRNRIREEGGRARQLARLLAQAEARPPAAAGAGTVPPETLAALRSLGYAGGGTVSEPGPGLADPKDRTVLRQILTEGDDLLRRGDFRAAVAKLDAVLADEPENRFALSRSGEALLRLGNLEAGLARLRRAAALDPGRAEIRELLGSALVEAGRLDEALGEWRELVALRPGDAMGWSNLGATLGRLGRYDDAVTAYERAVDLAPADPDRLVRLAFAEHAAGRPAATARHLLAAADLAGERFFHHGALGLVLMGLGQVEKARTHLALSRPSEGDFAAARFELARLEAAAGRTDEARTALAEALRARPEWRQRAAADPVLAALLDGR